MTLTSQVRLLPTKEQGLILDETMNTYICSVNEIIDCAIATDNMPTLSSKSLSGIKLPSALKDQVRLDAKSVWKKTIKNGGRFPVLKKPVATWNNQNYHFDNDGCVYFPVWKDNKSYSLHIKMFLTNEVSEKFYELIKTHKMGTMRITKKSNKYIAQFSYTQTEAEPLTNEKIMGIDVGIKCPAVSIDTNGRVRFYGNGRQRRFIRRKFYSRRKKFGMKKKPKVIKRIGNKENRWMTDQDHKISRAIVNEAKKQGISIIRMETLQGIRKNITYTSTTSKSRKNNRNANSWSFYRLQNDIEYKAKLAGISVEYINPAYTSQICPNCGEKNHAKDRLYVCAKCGYKTHRDRVGAVNIRNAQPGVSGN